MKAAFLLLFFIPLISFAQQKGDSKIIATPSDTTRLFYKLITLLYTEGYTIKTDDSARGIIITDSKTLPTSLHPQVRLKLLVNNTVTITGELDAGIERNAFYEPITNKGVKGSFYRTAWAEMDRIAKTVGTVTYSK